MAFVIALRRGGLVPSPPWVDTPPTMGTMSKPRGLSEGDRYVVGDQPWPRTPEGADQSAAVPPTLFPGQVVTVREFVDAGTPGAHDDAEDAVVIEWDEPSPVFHGYGEGNRPQFGQGTARRSTSVGVADFHESFQEAK